VSGTRGGTRTGGESSPLGDQDSISGDAQRGVMMESLASTSPSYDQGPDSCLSSDSRADAPAQLGKITSCRELKFTGRVESQYLVGLRSPSATRSAATMEMLIRE